MIARPTGNIHTPKTGSGAEWFRRGSGRRPPERRHSGGAPRMRAMRLFAAVLRIPFRGHPPASLCCASPVPLLRSVVYMEGEVQRGDMTTQAAPNKLIKGATGDWEVVIGMEIHAQVTSNAKLFSGASRRIWRRAQRSRLARRRGHAGHAAGHQRGMRQAGDPHRSRPARRRSICARSSTARIISIPICRRAIRSRSTSIRSSARAR